MKRKPNKGMFQKGHTQLLFKNPSNWIIKNCICGQSFETLKVRNIKFCGKICRYKYKKGPGPHSEETKRKIGLANKKFYAKHPEKLPSWAGGVTFNPGYKTLMRKKSRLNTVGSHTNAEWKKLRVLYGFTCPACLREEPEIKLTQDHIVPLIKGGDDYIGNIQPLCGPCNTRKMTKIIKYECSYAKA